MSDPILTDPLLAAPGSHVSPDERARNLRLGAWLLVAADGFIFVGFLFAYVYLRSLNVHGRWRPAHTTPSAALGTVTLLAVLGGAGALFLALRALRDGRPSSWRAAAGAGLAAYVLAFAIQCWQVVDPGFSPSSGGGYGSVFVGFTAVLAVHLLGAVYWLETILASSGAFHRRHGEVVPSALYEPAATAFGTFALYLAAVEVVAFVLLYLA